jgi:hypothetical protein
MGRASGSPPFSTRSSTPVIAAQAASVSADAATCATKRARVGTPIRLRYHRQPDRMIVPPRPHIGTIRNVDACGAAPRWPGTLTKWDGTRAGSDARG